MKPGVSLENAKVPDLIEDKNLGRSSHKYAILPKLTYTTKHKVKYKWLVLEANDKRSSVENEP